MKRKISPESPEGELHVMSFGEHIEELRRRLIYGLLGLSVVFAIMLYYARSLVAWMFEPLATAQRILNLPAQSYTRSSLGGMTVYLKVAIIGALVIAAPWLMYQAWKFVSAGLYAAERRAATFLVAMSTVMTTLALLLTYYVLIPAAIVFLLQFTLTYPTPQTSRDSFMWWWSERIAQLNRDSILPGAPAVHPQPPPAQTEQARVVVPRFMDDPPNPMEGEIWHNHNRNETREFRNGNIVVYVTSPQSLMGPMIDPTEYLSEAIYMTLGVVVVFHVPIVMSVLGMTGLVNPKTLAKRRGWALFWIFTAGIILVPGQDIFTNFAIPAIAYVLFEIGLVLMGVFYRRQERRKAEADARYGDG